MADEQLKSLGKSGIDKRTFSQRGHIYRVHGNESGLDELLLHPLVKDLIQGVTPAQVATAMVALDWVARTRLPLDTFIAVPQEAFGLRAGNPMDLQPGDRRTLRDALYSTLLGSDNVSAPVSYTHLDVYKRQELAGDVIVAIVEAPRVSGEEAAPAAEEAVAEK